MALQTQEIKRVFRYNGLTLPDPNPGMHIDKVKSMFAMQFPELNNSAVEGPVTKGGVATFTFIRAVGAKG